MEELHTVEKMMERIREIEKLLENQTLSNLERKTLETEKEDLMYYIE